MLNFYRVIFDFIFYGIADNFKRLLLAKIMRKKVDKRNTCFYRAKRKNGGARKQRKSENEKVIKLFNRDFWYSEIWSFKRLIGFF